MQATYDAPIRATAAALDQVLASGSPSVVVFETPDCEPCLSLRPQLEFLAREYRRRLAVIRVSDAAQGWLAARYHLVFVPTLLFWRDGREVARIAGNPGLAAVRAHADYLLDGLIPPEPAGGPRHTLRASFSPVPAGREPALLTAGH